VGAGVGAALGKMDGTGVGTRVGVGIGEFEMLGPGVGATTETVEEIRHAEIAKMSVTRNISSHNTTTRTRGRIGAGWVLEQPRVHKTDTVPGASALDLQCRRGRESTSVFLVVTSDPSNPLLL